MMSRLQRWVAIGLITMAILLLPASALAHGPSGAGGGDAFRNTFVVVLAIAAPIFLLVQGLLIFAVVRYRRRSDTEMPTQVTGNRRLEWTWTLGSFAIILVLFGITVRVLADDAGPPDNAMPIDVIGHQFYWEVVYPDTGVTFTSASGAEALMIPAERPVVLRITSADVQHSFWVPDWGGKVDAIPGRVNTMWFDFHETGSYVARCAEYCGRAHYSMMMDVEVVDGDTFDAWMHDKVKHIGKREAVGVDLDAPLPAGDPVAGEQVFHGYGCEMCHSLTGESRSTGPTLLGIGAKAAERREGYPADRYLHEAIVQPCAYLVNGYPCIMPEEYGQQMTAQELADLIAYLSQQ